MDDYPTEEDLEAIKTAPHDKVLDLARPIWTFPDYWTTRPAPRGEVGTHHYVSTAGWSGNEAIISAMMDNTIFWTLHWVSSRRGGHYVFTDT